MNIIDIIGPVMIGPSSSHTAGAVRLGLLAAGILGGAIAPTICVSLFSAWQSTVPVVVYLTILLLLAYVCVYTTKTE